LEARPRRYASKDYVRFRLTGERATDMADASGTLLLDVAHRRWSHEMLQAAESMNACCPLSTNLPLSAENFQQRR